MCMHMSVHWQSQGHRCAMVCIRKFEDKDFDSDFSFHIYVGLRDATEINVLQQYCPYEELSTRRVTYHSTNLSLLTWKHTEATFEVTELWELEPCFICLCVTTQSQAETIFILASPSSSF